VLQDRIELQNKIYNIYTDLLSKREEVYSVIYLEYKNYCEILAYRSIKVDKEIEKENFISYFHNNILSKLFMVLRREDGSNLKESLKKTSKIEEENGDKGWIDYCKKHLPAYAEICCLIEDDCISCYSKDELDKIYIKRIKSIVWPIRDHQDKIKNTIGSIKHTFYNDGKRHHFVFPLAEKRCIAVVSNMNIPIGRQLREMEKFTKETWSKG